MPCVAILTYHPAHVIENTYSGNDLLALESDLETIQRLRIPIRSLDQIFTVADSPRLLNDQEGLVVAITFDDGSALDFVDRGHPTCGPQRSAATILKDCALKFDTLAPSWPRASTFLIASPEARAELDRVDYLGLGFWPDDWWRAAAESGVLGLESHSWDHNHPSLQRSEQRDNVRGTFNNIETYAEAEAEIAQSVEYIARRAGASPKFFAYPWGEASAFLAEEYLPGRGRELGLRAAFSGGMSARGCVTDDSDRWRVPRFVCGFDWKSSADLEALLRACAEGGG